MQRFYQAGSKRRAPTPDGLRRIVGWSVVALALGIFLLSSSVQAANENWKFIGSNDKGESFFYDANSVVPFSADMIRVWTKQIAHAAPMRILKEINCKFKVVRNLQVTVEGSPAPPRISPSQWSAMEQDPVTLKLFKALCR